jgi:hypothetical protein
MRNTVSLVVVIAALIFSCSTKEKQHHEGMKAWKELNSFHEIMAAAFHPLKDSGSIAPAKKLAVQLADEAAHWASSSLPDQVNNDKVKGYLEQLKTDSRAFADQVAQGAADDVLKQKLTALHDQFHKIMEAFERGHHNEGEEHDEDHDHDNDDDHDEDDD